MTHAESSIKKDEIVVFYPTCGRVSDDGRTWSLRIHGSIFEPENDSIQRAALLSSLRRLLGLSRQQSETNLFRRRVSGFLVDNERGKPVTVRLGSEVYPAGTSEANGHFQGTLEVASALVVRLADLTVDGCGWLTYRAVTGPGDDRVFTGRVRLIGRRGLSVISDVDDTIKISQVNDRRELLANTFLRKFKAVPGMSAVYGDWADQGAVFHYLSGSPWQLYEPVSEFCAREGFPAGSFHMKLFRLKDSSALDMFGSQRGHKSAVIERLLTDFPLRRFVLVGDSGEEDPEIYGRAARQHARQIEGIFIRAVDGSVASDARWKTAFAGIAPNRWKVFRHPDELKGLVTGTS